MEDRETFERTGCGAVTILGYAFLAAGAIVYLAGVTFWGW